MRTSEEKQMLGLKLVRLIERHSEELALGLAQRLQDSERTRDFKKIPRDELHLTAMEVYRNLEEWLLQKKEDDIEKRFRAIAGRRAAQAVRLQQLVWALIISRNHLWHFLQRECFVDSIVEPLANSRFSSCSPVLRSGSLLLDSGV
jgi:hypothetical protein